jgi:hypothetical protein
MAAAEVRVIRVMNVDPPDKRGSVAVCSCEIVRVRGYVE